MLFSQEIFCDKLVNVSRSPHRPQKFLVSATKSMQSKENMARFPEYRDQMFELFSIEHEIASIQEDSFSGRVCQHGNCSTERSRLDY